MRDEQNEMSMAFIDLIDERLEAYLDEVEAKFCERQDLRVSLRAKIIAISKCREIIEDFTEGYLNDQNKN